MQYGIYILALSFLYFFSPVSGACVPNVTHCKHPDQMILRADNQLLENAINSQSLFTPPTGYVLNKEPSLDYCPFGATLCSGNITYTFDSICNDSAPILLAMVSFSCESESSVDLSITPPSTGTIDYLNELSAPLKDIGIVMFVSSIARTGGATLQQRDQDCQNDANTQFAGTYKAFLAVNDSVGPLARFYPLSTSEPVVRPDLDVIISPESDLLLEPYGAFTPLLNPPNELATGVPYHGLVYTGLTINPAVPDAGGLQTGPTHRCRGELLTGKTCSGYTCSLHECREQSGTYGDANSRYEFLYVNYTICDTPLPVYCLRDLVPFQCPST